MRRMAVHSGRASSRTRRYLRTLIAVTIVIASLLALSCTTALAAPATAAFPARPAVVSPAILAAPGGLRATASPGRAVASWSAVSGATVYELDISGPVRYDHVLPPGQRSAYAILRPGRYAVRARAGRSATDVHGHWSAVLAITVPAPAAVATAPSSLAARALAWALAQAGKPYVWGGTGPYGYDCSGLVMEAYAHAGASLPRTTYAMLSSAFLVRTYAPQPGDLAFYGSGHVELYARPGVTFGAHDSGSLIGFISEWEAPVFYQVR